MGFIVGAVLMVLAIATGGVGILAAGGVVAASAKLACLALVAALLLGALARPHRTCSYPRAYEPWCR